MFFQKFRNRVESLIVLLDLIRSRYYLISLSRYSSLYSGSQVICINALLCMHTSTWNFRITLKNDGQKKILILGTLGRNWNFQVERSNFVDIKNISYAGKTALGIVQFMVSLGWSSTNSWYLSRPKCMAAKTRNVKKVNAIYMLFIL